MKPIAADVNLVAYCGLYCGACGAYRRGRCPGCHENSKATWCKVRSCCMENGHSSCADCKTPADPRECRKFNNFIAKIFGLIFRSDRRACRSLAVLATIRPPVAANGCAAASEEKARLSDASTQPSRVRDVSSHIDAHLPEHSVHVIQQVAVVRPAAERVNVAAQPTAHAGDPRPHRYDPAELERA